MKQEEILYTKVMELGFTRQDMNDPEFVKQFGYQWFIVEKELFSGIVESGDTAEKIRVVADWDCITRTVRVTTVNQEADIIGEKPIKDYQELKSIIKMFDKNALK